MKTISAIIITLNEEKNIDTCLESLKGVADEVIVIDSFSTDKTKEICLKYKVKFIEHEWEGYSKTKNYGNNLAVSDFILSVDADEALSPELRKSLLSLKTGNSPHNAYELSRVTNYCGKWIKHGGWYPDKKVRLWKNRTAQWIGDIHEELELPANTEIGSLSGDLYHYSFHTVQQHERQIAKFTDIAAKNDYARGRKTNGIRIFLYPKWKFFRDYVLRMGFLDGYYGYIVCKMSAHASFLKYIKLNELNK